MKSFYVIFGPLIIVPRKKSATVCRIDARRATPESLVTIFAIFRDTLIEKERGPFHPPPWDEVICFLFPLIL